MESSDRLRSFDGSGIRILSPRPEEEVLRSVKVECQTPILPAGWSKWVLVYAPGAKLWYPTKIENAEEFWFADITVGSVDCDGAVFTICLFIADPEAGIYLDSVHERTSTLPPGLQVSVRVRRAPRATFVSGHVTNSTVKGNVTIKMIPGEKEQNIAGIDQSITGSEIKGNVVQLLRTSGAGKQRIDNISAKDVTQINEELKTELKIGRSISAQGKFASVLLAILVISYFIFQIVMHIYR